MTLPLSLRRVAEQLEARVITNSQLTIDEMADLCATLHHIDAHQRMMQRATAGSDQDAALVREPVVGGLIAAAHGDSHGADVVRLAERRGQPRLCALGKGDGK